jgi:hypothetical protein
MDLRCKKLNFMAILLLVLSACNMVEDGQPALQFEIPQIQKSQYEISAPLRSIKTTGNKPPHAPTDVSGFDCVLINVVGSGIGEWDNNADRVGVGRNFSYFGTYSRLVSTSSSATITLKIKKGSSRYIQLIGVNSSIGCPSNATASDLNSFEKFPGMFIIGSVQKDIFSNQTIALKSTYSATDTADVRGDEDTPWYDSPPEVGVLTLAPSGSDSVSASWTKATDDGTAQEAISYKLVYSTNRAAIDSVDEVVSTNSNIVIEDENVTTASVNSLTSGVEYFFSLLVKDNNGKGSLYQIKSITLSGNYTCTCSAGSYSQDGSGSNCATAEAGYWAQNCVRTACTNQIPNNSTYSAGNVDSTCDYTCDTGYKPSEGLCLPELPGGTNFGCTSTDAIAGFKLWTTTSQVKGIQIICRQNNSGSPNGSDAYGMSMGDTTGASPVEFKCSNQYGIVKVSFENTALNKLAAVKFTCEKRNSANKPAPVVSGVYGTTSSSVPDSINCSDETTYLNSLSVTVMNGEISSVDTHYYCK